MSLLLLPGVDLVEEREGVSGLMDSPFPRS